MKFTRETNVMDMNISCMISHPRIARIILLGIVIFTLRILNKDPENKILIERSPVSIDLTILLQAGSLWAQHYE